MEENDSVQFFFLFRLKAKMNAIHGWVLQGFDTIWYLILQGELQAPLFRGYGYDMICQKCFVFFN